MYHKQGPDGVVEEDGGGYDEHACADERTKLGKSLSMEILGMQHVAICIPL